MLETDVLDGDKTAVPPSPQSNSTIDPREVSSYNLYLEQVGPRPLAVVELLRPYLADGYVVPEIRRYVKWRIVRKQPVIVALDKPIAEYMQARFTKMGAVAKVYHYEDEARPDHYDPRCFGLRLEEVGTKETAVKVAIQKILGVSSAQTTRILASVPCMILKSVTIDEAIDAHSQLHGLMAVCSITDPYDARRELPQPSMSHINKAPGNYQVLLKAAGLEKMDIAKMIYGLMDEPDLSLANWLADTAPSVVLEDVDKETAVAVQEKLEQFFARVRVEKMPANAASKQRHAINPKLHVGEYDVILEGYDPSHKIQNIQILRDILVGKGLLELKTLVEAVPAVVISGVSLESAEKVSAQLSTKTGRVTIQKKDAR